MGFSYAAQAVEVSVDLDLGTIRVDKVWSAIDCGFAINPMSVEGQVQGAVWMGMGQALCEQTVYEQGRHHNANLLDYRVPTTVDSPEIEVHIVESIDPNGPFGAKEASEGPLSGFLSALPGPSRMPPVGASRRHRSPMPMCSMHCSKPAAGGPAR